MGAASADVARSLLEARCSRMGQRFCAAAMVCSSSRRSLAVGEARGSPRVTATNRRTAQGSSSGTKARRPATAPISRQRLALWEALDYLRDAMHLWKKPKLTGAEGVMRILEYHLQSMGLLPE